MDASTSRGIARRARARRFRYRHGWHRLLGARSRPSDRHGTDLLSLRRGAGHLPTRRLGSPAADALSVKGGGRRSEEHTSELQSLMRISYAVFCSKKKTNQKNNNSSTK